MADAAVTPRGASTVLDVTNSAARTKRIGWDREVQRLRALYANLDSSVVNGDQRFWGIPNLYTIDGSVFPTAGGYNPTLTIEALAWRTAEGIAKRHGYRR